MSRKLLVGCLAALVVWTGVGTEPVVVVAGETAVVRRAGSDGLDAIVQTRMA